MLTPVDKVKHPLQNEWSFWMFTNREKNWKANLVELTSFDTVEDYWCLYHNMKVPSELKLGQDYLVFKKGIKPMWEDEANKYGGRLLIMLDGVQAVHMDSIWSDAHEEDTKGRAYLVCEPTQGILNPTVPNERTILAANQRLLDHGQFRTPSQVLLLIGETFEHADEITGVVVNVRDKKKISIWMRSAKRKAVVEIGKKLRALFQIPCRIHFYKHNSSASLFSF